MSFYVVSRQIFKQQKEELINNQNNYQSLTWMEILHTMSLAYYLQKHFIWNKNVDELMSQNLNFKFEFHLAISFWSDEQTPIQVQAYTPKLAKMAQPDLDFTAPEIMSNSTGSPQSDMFSLGLLIFSLFNQGKSPLESNLSPQNYIRQLDLVKFIYLLFHLSVPSSLHPSFVFDHHCILSLQSPPITSETWERTPADMKIHVSPNWHDITFICQYH